MDPRTKAIGDIIDAATKKGGRAHHRSPLEVTSDRIAEHIGRYHDKLTGSERDQLSQARFLLEELLHR